MYIGKKIGLFILGIVISVSAQLIGLPLSGVLRIPDPAFTILYSSLGVLISVAFAVYFGLKKNWSLAAGVTIGIPFWWFFIFLSMAVTGSWL